MSTRTFIVGLIIIAAISAASIAYLAAMLRPLIGG